MRHSLAHKAQNMSKHVSRRQNSHKIVGAVRSSFGHEMRDDSFVVSLIHPSFSLHCFTLRNYGERDKTTAFLENKGTGPLCLI
ncbi:hypothetical protein VNO77_24720 [Canavalia gladiata]|uniref:Uncharacterized protein n=1 Tax=Canavalia gladiata TaxID=3824 RepID=A0AAN9L6V8_CANGL